MRKNSAVAESDLASLAAKFRNEAGKTRAQAAREMNVSQTSIFNAEEKPDQSLTKLRIRMIEAYSLFEVSGAFYFLERKSGKNAKGEKTKTRLGV